jgi:hypothetical protein
MGFFMRPRRPLLRLATGAATAGVAYHMGKKSSQQDAYNQQAQSAYEATSQPPPPPQASAQPTDTTSELARLAQLHQSGQLDDAEFAAAKARLLGL